MIEKQIELEMKNSLKHIPFEIKKIKCLLFIIKIIKKFKRFNI